MQKDKGNKGQIIFISLWISVFAVSLVTFYLIKGVTAVGIRDFAFTQILFIIAHIDYNKKIIPDACVIAGAAVWFIAAPFTDSGFAAQLKTGIPGAAVLAALLLAAALAGDKLFGKETLGGGDIKIIAVTGLYLGIAAGLINLILIAMAGLICRACAGKERFALGPAIGAATYVSLLIGTEFAELVTGG